MGYHFSLDSDLKFKHTSAMQRPHREKLLKTTMGFLTQKEDESLLLAEDHLQPVLVRCGNGRFSCPIQDLQHFVNIINKDGRDYVRDVSVQH